MQSVPEREKEKLTSRLFLKKLAVVILLAIVYFLAGKLGLSLASINPSATAVWPPAGIALAAFLILGGYVWPGILLGAFLVNFTTSNHMLSAFSIGLGNTLEGFIGAYLINRFANGHRTFARAQDVLKFAILAGLVGTIVSATIGVTSLAYGGLAEPSEFLTIWLTWWLGDVGGVLIVAPLLILWFTTPKLLWTPIRIVEALLLILSLILLSLAVFSDQSPMGANNYPLEFTIAPWIIWAAFRFGQRETSTVTAIISAIAIMGTLRGFGPFGQINPNEALLLLQGFMATVTITGLVLAALVSERSEIEGTLRGTNDQLMVSVQELEQHNGKIILLNEMGDLLQSCVTVDEVYAVVGQFGRRVFPEESGALYVINESQNIVSSMIIWGPYPPELDIFALDECWALRRGHTHMLRENGLELVCPHLKNQTPLVAMCIPMTAQGEIMGVLHLQNGSPLSNQVKPDNVLLSETKIQLAQTMAETIALALANLKLRTSLLHQSIRDPLTGLFNRRYLEETLDREIHRAARLQRGIAVIMLDIDHFKHFNDAFGHEAGDTLLRELGAFLRQQIRGGDFACRYGGEEFALIFPEMALTDLRPRAEKLREEVKNLHVMHDRRALETITLSLGVAFFPEHGTTGKALLQAADGALYHAKHMGRDQVVIAEGSPQEEPPV